MAQNEISGDARQGTEQKVLHQTNDQPVKVKLESTAVGYRWEIHIVGKTFEEIFPQLRNADASLRELYGPKETPRGQ